MFPSTLPRLTAGGQELDLAPDKFGELRTSNDIKNDGVALMERMKEDGYLYIKGFFDRDKIWAVRKEIARQLAEEGQLDAHYPVDDLIAKPGLEMWFRPDISNANQMLQSVIYGPRVLGFYERMLGAEVLHYDFTWLRVVAPGKGTYPHCDIVYMGRGTHGLFTAWVPYGDVPLSVGGLIILEGSHKNAELNQTYCQMDVDATCENKPGKNQVAAGGFVETGAIDEDFLSLQRRLGGRWLTAEYEMGDLLTFSMYTVHGSLDNGSNQIRISSDSRYQRADEPVDPRWVGENPPAHGSESKRNLIC